jgi:hypothetical protein
MILLASTVSPLDATTAQLICNSCYTIKARAMNGSLR